MRSSTGILPVSPTGVSPVEDDKVQGQDGPATHGQDAHTTTSQLLKHLLRIFSHHRTIRMSRIQSRLYKRLTPDRRRLPLTENRLADMPAISLPPSSEGGRWLVRKNKKLRRRRADQSGLAMPGALLPNLALSAVEWETTIWHPL
ncbi:MAG: hypothetical protein A2Z25_08735 [Planctomycetes bacterium RBG_16_55_9]|nr:MAG: hypothetical protein A2Z25_08735 [Planctomycetes bacterium RBG_16_55_9]